MNIVGKGFVLFTFHEITEISHNNELEKAGNTQQWLENCQSDIKTIEVMFDNNVKTMSRDVM